MKTYLFGQILRLTLKNILDKNLRQNRFLCPICCFLNSQI